MENQEVAVVAAREISPVQIVNYADKDLSQLASVVYRDWKKVNYAAVPYLEALSSLSSVKDSFGADSGYSVVAYFLSNAASWKGEVAKAVKKELNRRLKS